MQCLKMFVSVLGVCVVGLAVLCIGLVPLIWLVESVMEAYGFFAAMVTLLGTTALLTASIVTLLYCRGQS